MPANWNNTVVVLIPKVQSPKWLKYLHPTSLCNVVYKIVIGGWHNCLYI